MTADVSLARNILAEISRETQTEGWQWNTEDDYPLTPDAAKGEIKLPPTAIRVHFREPDGRELTIRGQRVYDRVNHSFTFPSGTRIPVTLTLLLPFEDLPEAARRYVTLKAARVFQERTVGSGTLYDFQQADEARARALMLAEERRQDQAQHSQGHLAAHRHLESLADPAASQPEVPLMGRLITTAIANLISGVSQQPWSVRLPTQAEEQVNCYSSVTDFLKRRPATRHLAELPAPEGDAAAGVAAHVINRDANEKYIALFSTGGIIVRDLDGNPKSVTLQDSAADYLAQAANAGRDDCDS